MTGSIVNAWTGEGLCIDVETGIHVSSSKAEGRPVSAD